MSVAAAHPVPRAALRVTARSVPETEPPYDDAPAPEPARRGLPRYVPDPAPPALRLVPRRAAPSPGEPGPRAAMLARALLEAEAGVRPLGQIVRWVTPDVLAVVRSMVASRAARPVATALRRVLVSEPAEGVAEVTAIVQRGARAEALALRMEAIDGRWQVTALQRA